MTFVRSHRSALAMMLAGLILLGTLACSFGHGKMLGAFMPAAAAELCGDAVASAPGPASGSGEHALLMQLALFECAYASQLTGPLVGLVALGWLLRVLRRRALMPHSLVRAAGRHTLPGRVPQAP